MYRWKTDAHRQALRSVPLFAGCTDAELREIDRTAETLDLDAGRVLVREGAYGRYAYVLVSGAADVHSGERHTDRLGPGDLVGEMSLLDLQPRTATVRAVTPLTVLMLDRRGLQLILAMDSVAEKVARQLCGRLRRVEVMLGGDLPDETAARTHGVVA